MASTSDSLPCQCLENVLPVSSMGGDVGNIQTNPGSRTEHMCTACQTVAEIKYANV